ncbi:hypothetical protein [Niveibacterium sp. SC-1]|uniref:hypothetical protein n=1 Tax=Niveibacterium sp. SC-1 TaxID=3135646 RepID=UPI0031200A77
MQESFEPVPSAPRMPSLFLGSEVLADGVPVLVTLGPAQATRGPGGSRLLRAGSAIGLLAVAVGVYAAFDFSTQRAPLGEAVASAEQLAVRGADKPAAAQAQPPVPAAAAQISDEHLPEASSLSAPSGLALAEPGGTLQTDGSAVKALTAENPVPAPVALSVTSANAATPSRPAGGEAKRKDAVRVQGNSERKAGKPSAAGARKGGDPDVLLIETLIRLDKSGLAKADAGVKP